jgi:hypothetical protein
MHLGERPEEDNAADMTEEHKAIMAKIEEKKKKRLEEESKGEEEKEKKVTTSTCTALNMVACTCKDHLPWSFSC